MAGVPGETETGGVDGTTGENETGGVAGTTGENETEGVAGTTGENETSGVAGIGDNSVTTACKSIDFNLKDVNPASPTYNQTRSFADVCGKVIIVYSTLFH